MGLVAPQQRGHGPHEDFHEDGGQLGHGRFHAPTKVRGQREGWGGHRHLRLH